MASHWKVYLGVLFLSVMVTLGSWLMYKQSDHLRVETVRDATLVQAYQYDDRCGHKGRSNCSAYKGRFLVEPEHVYVNMKIDGFFYHSYVDKGRKDTASFITVSKLDLGQKEPPYTTLWSVLMLIGSAISIAWFFVMGFACLIEDHDRRDRRHSGW